MESAEVIKSWRLSYAAKVKNTSAFTISTGTPRGKRPLGRPTRTWEDNFRMYFKETVVHAENWVDSARDRDCWRALVNAGLNLRVP